MCVCVGGVGVTVPVVVDAVGSSTVFEVLKSEAVAGFGPFVVVVFGIESQLPRFVCVCAFLESLIEETLKSSSVRLASLMSWWRDGGFAMSNLT